MRIEKWYQEEIDTLVRAISELNNTKDVDRFMDLISTPREINDMARRLAASVMIQEGASYSEIRQKLGLNPNTIARISSHVGFGFRRSHDNIAQPESKPKKPKSPVRRYKGAPPLHRIFR